eukprot:gene6074-10082_t
MRCVPPDSNPQLGEPVGLITCETIDPSVHLDFQGFLDYNIKNLQNISKQWTTQNLTHGPKMNSNRFIYEEINYELFSNKSNVTKHKTCIFFQNGIAVQIQNFADASKFKSDLLDNCVDTANFFTPK